MFYLGYTNIDGLTLYRTVLSRDGSRKQTHEKCQAILFMDLEQRGIGTLQNQVTESLSFFHNHF
jgi:hypothetical protein